jgi:hypothetical protein
MDARKKSAVSSWQVYARRHGAWLLLGVALVFVLGVRWRLREMPLDRDEGEYAYIGRLMLEGVAPYKTVFTDKLPGVPAFYAVFITLFGRSATGMHIGLALVSAASVLLTFLIGRRLLDDVAGAASAVSLALLTLNPWAMGLAGHASHFVVFAALAGMWTLLRGCDAAAGLDKNAAASSSGRLYAWLFVSGLLFGFAILTKPQALFFAAFGGIYLTWRRTADWFMGDAVEVSLGKGGSGRDGENRRKALIPARRGRLRPEMRVPGRLKSEVVACGADVSLFGAGVLLPGVLMCLGLWLAGAFRDFVLQTAAHSSDWMALPLARGSDMVRAADGAVMGPSLLLWILPIAGAVIMWWDRRLVDSRQRFERAGRQKVDIAGPWALASSPLFDQHEAEFEERPEAAGGQVESPSPVRYPRVFLCVLCVCSMGSIIFGREFRGSWFIQLLPAFSLLTGVAVSRAIYLLRHDRTVELFLALPILLFFILAIGAAFVGNGSIWLAMSPLQAANSVYRSALFGEAAQAAEFVASISPSDAKVAVLGSEPEIYFMAQRRSATGFISMYPMMEPGERGSRMQHEMIAQIERAQPDVLVYVDDESSWRACPGSDRTIFSWWKDYWARELDLVHTIDIRANLQGASEETSPWAVSNSRTGEAGTVGHILVMRRKK